MAPAASPGCPDQPTGKAGTQQDPAAPQDAGACGGLGAPGLQSHPALQLGVGGGVHRSRVCATQGVKGKADLSGGEGIKQSRQEVLPSLGSLQAGVWDMSCDLHLVGTAGAAAAPGTSHPGNEERFDRAGGALIFACVLSERHIPCRVW